MGFRRFLNVLGETTFEILIVGMIYWLLERLNLVPTVFVSYAGISWNNVSGQGIYVPMSWNMTQTEGLLIFVFTIIIIITSIRFCVSHKQGIKNEDLSER